MIQLLLVDDHELVRAGLKRILEDAKGIKVIGEASTGEEAIQMVRARKPDVVIMDVNMPGIGGLETTRKLMQINPDIKVIVVTVHVDEPYPTRLLEAGAAGYLTKGSAPEVIVVARVTKSGMADARDGDLEGVSAPVASGAKAISISIDKVLSGQKGPGMPPGHP